MKFKKRMPPIIIAGYEAVEHFKSKQYAEKRKRFFELNDFQAIVTFPPKGWNTWFVCIKAAGGTPL